MGELFTVTTSDAEELHPVADCTVVYVTVYVVVAVG